MAHQHKTIWITKHGGARAAAAMAVCALLAAGCGARWDDDQRAAVVASNQGGGLAVGPGGSTDVTTADGRPAASARTGSTQPGAAGGQTGGATPGTPGAPGGEGVAPEAAGEKPCAAPSDAPGVTDDKITIGSISSLSGPVPGLGETSLAAVQAYVAYRNSNGGVCGRELVLNTADDGTDNGRFRATLDEMAPQVLGIVGGLATGDAGGAEVAERHQIPVVNTPISTSFQNVSTVFDINPPYADPNAAIAKYRYLYDQGIRKASLVYTAAEQTRSEAEVHAPQMIAAGIEVVQRQELPLSTLSFDSPARSLINSGADYAVIVLESTQAASLARSLRDAGAELKAEEYLIAYGTNFIELAGPAAEGTTGWIRTLPNEEPGTNGEHDTYLTWMEQVAPGLSPDTFSGDAWAAAKAFVDALDALPGPITREALVAQLRSVTSYDAGGMNAPIQLGPKLNNGCFIGMKVQGGAWTRMAPGSGFMC